MDVRLARSLVFPLTFPTESRTQISSNLEQQEIISSGQKWSTALEHTTTTLGIHRQGNFGSQLPGVARTVSSGEATQLHSIDRPSRGRTRESSQNVVKLRSYWVLRKDYNQRYGRKTSNSTCIGRNSAYTNLRYYSFLVVLYKDHLRLRKIKTFARQMHNWPKVVSVNRSTTQ